MTFPPQADVRIMLHPLGLLTGTLQCGYLSDCTGVFKMIISWRGLCVLYSGITRKGGKQGHARHGWRPGEVCFWRRGKHRKLYVLPLSIKDQIL